MRSILTLLLLLITLGSTAYAQEKMVNDLGKISWMSGSWLGEHKGNKLELNLTGTEGDVVIGNFKKLTPTNELRFARFMNFQPIKSGGIALRLFPFFRPSDDYYVTAKLTGTKAIFHRIYPKKSGCNILKVEDALNDSGELLKCDRFPVQIVYEKLPNGDFKESYLGYQYYNNQHHDVSFSRVYQSIKMQIDLDVKDE